MVSGIRVYWSPETRIPLRSIRATPTGNNLDNPDYVLLHPGYINGLHFGNPDSAAERLHPGYTTGLHQWAK